MAAGFRSGLEQKTADDLRARGVPFGFEEDVVRYTIPQSDHKYHPDFVNRRNGQVYETKGIFDSTDRKKHLFIKAQWPDLDIRILAKDIDKPTNPGVKQTIRQWCAKHGIPCANLPVPQEWLDEPPLQSRFDALEAARAS